MASTEFKEKHSKRLRNKYAKSLRDQGDHKGAFSLKVHDARKTEYKREKMRVTDINDEEE